MVENIYVKLIHLESLIIIYTFIFRGWREREKERKRERERQTERERETDRERVPEILYNYIKMNLISNSLNNTT